MRNRKLPAVWVKLRGADHADRLYPGRHAGWGLLTVTESGFDRIPLERRVKAFTANEQGWTMVVTLVADYLARAQ
jgi:hypothetical protein